MLSEELARAGVPFNGKNDNFSIKMIGNLLLRFGTEEQMQRFLRRIVSGASGVVKGSHTSPKPS